MQAVDVEALWGIFNSDAEQYLIQRAEGCTTARVQKYEGRGTVTVQKRRAQVAPQRDCTGAAGIRVRRLLRMTRRLEDLIRQMDRASAGVHVRVGACPRAWAHLWELCRSDALRLLDGNVVAESFRCSSLPSLQHVKRLSQTLRLIVAEEQEARAAPECSLGKVGLRRIGRIPRLVFLRTAKARRRLSALCCVDRTAP